MMKITANLPDPSMETTTGLPAAGLEKTETTPGENSSASGLETPLKRLRQQSMPREELMELLQQYSLLSKLQRELILDEELATVTCTPAEIFSAYKAFDLKYQINSDADRSVWLERNHFSLSQFEYLVLKNIKLDRFKQTVFAHKVDSYFLQRKSQLDRVFYSILRVKNLHLAQELFFRIQAGEAVFTELVKQYSGGDEVEMDGLVGPHELSVPHPILAQVLRSLRAGEVSAPVQIADWFVIIRLEKYLPAQLNQEIRVRLADELYEQWIQEKLNQLIVSN